MAGKRVTLPKAHRVTKQLAGGRFGIYIYAFRGGPLLKRFAGASRREAERAELDGASELIQVYAAQKVVRTGGETVRDLVRLFKEVPEGLKSLQPSTRVQWSRWLDKIDAEFGDMPLRLMKARGVRATFIKWRDSFSASPRSADYAIQVLRRVLELGVKRELIDVNPAKGIDAIYKVNRAEIVVTDDQLAKILAHATPRARLAIRLAAALGLRRGDLVRLQWDHVRKDHIELTTNKSRGKTFVISPLVGDGRNVIDELREERARMIAEGQVPSAFVLTTELGTPWQAPSLTQAFIRAAKLAKVSVTLHDLRGTAATRFIKDDFTPQEVATFLGWERARVEEIIRRYVDPAGIARKAIARLEPRRATG